MKRSFVLGIVCACLVGFLGGSQVFAGGGKLGLEGTLGKSSMGVVWYEDAYAGGVFFGQGQDQTSTIQSSTTTVGLWAALRHRLDTKLFFNYGINTYLKSGTYKGMDLETFGLSPFVGFEYEATPHFLLTAWCNLYDYNTTKMTSGSVSSAFTSTSIFQSYAGITYLF